MLKMSFYDRTLNRDEAYNVIEQSNKQLYHRYGFAYRGAEARPISKENALGIVQDKGNLLDIKENNDAIILNTFSDNDMW